jgi:hypothetical protein
MRNYILLFFFTFFGLLPLYAINTDSLQKELQKANGLKRLELVNQLAWELKYSNVKLANKFVICSLQQTISLINKLISQFQNWYLRATFGNWNNLTSNLSKAIRTYLTENDKKEYCKNLFGNPSEAFLSMITSKGIVNVLFEVANLRNKWKGHGGITSEEENNQRVLTLEQQLNEFRKYIADAFEDTRMLSPTTSSFEDGIFTFNAKELIGARTPFNEITIKSLIPLDRKKLYLSNSQQTKPLELLPFIKFIEASDEIYFSVKPLFLSMKKIILSCKMKTVIC